jgi:hypothetical protein
MMVAGEMEDMRELMSALRSVALRGAMLGQAVENANFGDMSTVDAAALAGNQKDISAAGASSSSTGGALTVPVAAIRVAMMREAQDHEHDHQMVAG